MAELADAHGSGPCDSNIMRVQVPSSARRLKSKDLSLFRYYIFTTFSSIQAKFYWHSKHYRRHIHCPQMNIPKAQGIPLFSDFLCLSPTIAAFRYFISAAASKKRTPHRHCSRLAQTVPPSPLAYSRASRDRLRQSSSPRKFTSLAHSCLFCNREFPGISYYAKTSLTDHSIRKVFYSHQLLSQFCFC